MLQCNGCGVHTDGSEILMDQKTSKAVNDFNCGKCVIVFPSRKMYEETFPMYSDSSSKFIGKKLYPDLSPYPVNIDWKNFKFGKKIYNTHSSKLFIKEASSTNGKVVQVLGGGATLTIPKKSSINQV